MQNENLKIYFEWDTISWSRSMKIWQKYLDANRDSFALEIGGRRGGLSLLLAKEYGMKVVCSDLNDPEITAKLLHKQYQTKYEIQYEGIDCTQIPHKDNTFDVVIFKSVIGALVTFEKQQLAFQEILRVLKPGGVLLFAENLKASALHMYLRKTFVRWSYYWRYPNLNEIHLLLAEFSHVELNTTGFFATFVRNQFVRIFLSYLDFAFEKLLPKKLRYIVLGAAVK